MMWKGLFLAAIAATLLAQPAVAEVGDLSFGIWRNPQNSVHVQAERCGKHMCGRVVWADDKAKADARRGGTAELIGLQLFRDFRLDKKAEWRGKVYVPDIGKTFSGSISVIDENRLVGTGCLIGRVGCKSQTWTRLP